MNFVPPPHDAISPYSPHDLCVQGFLWDGRCRGDGDIQSAGREWDSPRLWASEHHHHREHRLRRLRRGQHQVSVTCHEM